MHKTLIPIALISASLSAQGPIATYSVPGLKTLTRSFEAAGQTFSAVSRDAGRTWTPQGEVDTELHIRFGSFDPKHPPVVPSALHAPAANRLFLVQFHTRIITEFRAVLNGMGAELHHYVPSQSYLVRMDRALLGPVSELPFVRAVSEYHVAYRLDPEIIVGLGQSAGNLRYTIVMVDKRRDTAGLEGRARALGARDLIPANGGILFEATMTEAQMLAIAADDRTAWIERSSLPQEDIDIARIQGGTNYIDTLAGIRGIGMTGHIMEGVYSVHTEFAAIGGVRAAPIAPFDGSGSGHGTNTAGEIYARGASALYRGLMPNAQLIYTNYNYVINKSTRYGVTQSVIQNQRVMCDTASWGYSRTMMYTSRSAEMDDIIFDHDLFISQSQSNAGSTSQPRDSRPQAWSKNICAVGGFRHRNNTNAADDYWGRSGSTGPAWDGRIGPSLSAYYDSIRTTSGTSGYTSGFGGTSGATPIINGLAGNTIEMFTDGLFGYGKTNAKTAVERSRVLPHFSTTKALLIATASQLTYNNSGTSVGANRYQQGFGFPNLRTMYDERDRMLVIDELDVLRQGQSRSYFVFAKGGRLTAAMHYPDPEALANATIHRINSVDLRVVTSDKSGYWGNNGLLTGPVSTSGGSANDRDTEEVVHLSNAPPGVTQVTVQATGVRRDGHVETPAIDIDYALVVMGLCGMRDRSGLALDLESTGPGVLSAKLGNLPSSGWDHGYTMFSFATSRPISTGNAIGVEYDEISHASLRQPLAAGNVFHFSSGGGTNQYPRKAFEFPAPVALAVKGQTIDGVVILLNGKDVVHVSNVDRVFVK